MGQGGRDAGLGLGLRGGGVTEHPRLQAARRAATGNDRPVNRLSCSPAPAICHTRPGIIVASPGDAGWKFWECHR